MGIDSDCSHSAAGVEELEAFLPNQLQNIPCKSRVVNRFRFAVIAVGIFSYVFFLFAYLRAWHSSDSKRVWYRDELEGDSFLADTTQGSRLMILAYFSGIYADAPLQTRSQIILSRNGDMRSLYSYFNSTPDDPLVKKDAAIWQHDLAGTCRNMLLPNNSSREGGLKQCSVGMVTITQEEHANLPGNKGSAPLHNPETSEQIDGMYLLQTTASHQMTCLVRAQPTTRGSPVFSY